VIIQACPGHLNWTANALAIHSLIKSGEIDSAPSTIMVSFWLNFSFLVEQERSHNYNGMILLDLLPLVEGQIGTTNSDFLEKYLLLVSQ